MGAHSQWWGSDSFVELLNERQRFPYTFALALAFFIILGSYVAVHVTHPSQAATNKFYWYMARSAGFTSYCLLSMSVLLGVSTTSSMWDKWKLRKLMTQMHQYAALLVFPFLFFHLWGLSQDTSVPFHLLSLLVPFEAKYRPVYTGLGVLTLYGWLLLIVTSYLREKLSVRVWRMIHFASFPMFIAVTIHGLMTGSDSAQHWAMVMYFVPTVLFVILVVRRMSS
jgi:methionine sulfoxide reductase heme-binding subunit